MSMTFGGDAAKHGSGHSLDERDGAGDEAASLALIDDPVSSPLIGGMMPCDEHVEFCLVSV